MGEGRPLDRPLFGVEEPDRAVVDGLAAGVGGWEVIEAFPGSPYKPAVAHYYSKR